MKLYELCKFFKCNYLEKSKLGRREDWWGGDGVYFIDGVRKEGL